MPGPGPAWTQGPGGPWTPTSQNFVQHQLNHTINFWKLGHPAGFHLESLSGGRAKLNLTFCLPPPSEIIPPPPPSFPTSTFTPSRPGPHYPKRPVPPTVPPKRPVIPLFPQGEVPTPSLSSRQRKSYRRSMLHRASQATPLSSRKRLCSSSPVSLPQQLRQDFSLQDESPGSSPVQENLREAQHPSPPPSFSLNHGSPIQRDALPCSSTPTPTPESLRRLSPPTSPLSISLNPTSPQRDAPLSPPTLNLTPSPLPREENSESDHEKKDSLEVEKENKEADSVEEDSVKEEPKVTEEEVVLVDKSCDIEEKASDFKENMSRREIRSDIREWLKTTRDWF